MTAHHFTVDLEEYFQVTAFESCVARAQWEGFESRLARQVEQLLDLLARHEARATFFVLGWVANRHAELVRTIARAGHEIASHGWDHMRVTEQTPAQFRDSIRRTKNLLEAITGASVLGFRAPSFSIVPGYEWALDVLVEEGYRYDSSLFPVRRPGGGYGYPNGSTDPHWLERPAGRLAEIPPATLKWCGLQLPAGGGAYFRLLPYRLVRDALRQCERRNVPGTFYIHPWELDAAQPRLAVSWLTRVRHYGGLRWTAHRLDRLLADFRFTAVRDTVTALSPVPATHQPRSSGMFSEAIPRDETPRVEVFEGPGAEWDASARAADGWTHFHGWRWKAVIEQVFGHECTYLAARDDSGRVAGVLPLVRAKSRVFGDYLVSMPFLNYGGPLGSEPAVRALVAHAVSFARDRRVDLLELRSRERLPVDLPVSNRKITCLLDLAAGDAESVWRRLTSNVRRKVRRAQKEGISVRFGLDQVSAFYQVFSRHMRDLGTPTLPQRLFETLAERFPEDIWFGCAYYGGQPVAGGCGFQWGAEFELTWVSALEQHHRLYANMFLYWAFIERAANQKLSLFNFGRCTPGGGTHHFKQQWGSRDVPLMWYQLVAGRRNATPSPHERAFAWGPYMWKRLPLNVANALGPGIARLIP